MHWILFEYLRCFLLWNTFNQNTLTLVNPRSWIQLWYLTHELMNQSSCGEYWYYFSIHHVINTVFNDLWTSLSLSWLEVWERVDEVDGIGSTQALAEKSLKVSIIYLLTFNTLCPQISKIWQWWIFTHNLRVNANRDELTALLW